MMYKCFLRSSAVIVLAKGRGSGIFWACAAPAPNRDSSSNNFLMRQIYGNMNTGGLVLDEWFYGAIPGGSRLVRASVVLYRRGAGRSRRCGWKAVEARRMGPRRC